MTRATSPHASASRRYALPTVREVHPVPDPALRHALEAHGASPDAIEHARADERTRLYRELHDGVGAGLVGTILSVGAAQAAPAGTLRTVLAELERDLVEVARELRGVIDDLRPPALEELGLVGAVRRHAERLHSGTGLRVDIVTGPGIAALPNTVERAAHRIAGEALTNAARHAAASRCEVRIERTDDSLYLTVADDGRGMPAVARENVGRRSMRERAAELGGRCEWRERPGGGTVVDVRLPLASR